MWTLKLSPIHAISCDKKCNRNQKQESTHDVTPCLVPCSFQGVWCHFLSGPMFLSGGGYDVTSCLVPCSFQGVWCHFLSESPCSLGSMMSLIVWFPCSLSGGSGPCGMVLHPLWTEWQTCVEHYLPANSFAGGKNRTMWTGLNYEWYANMSFEDH